MTTIAPWVPPSTPTLPEWHLFDDAQTALGNGPDADLSDATPTAMTIAMIVEEKGASGPASVAPGLAELASTDELLVVYGSDEPDDAIGVHPLVAALREFLPRHTIVALHVALRDRLLGREAALLDDCLDVGSLPVVMTRAAAVPTVAMGLYHYLRANRVMRISSGAGGVAALRHVWRRR